jgi:Mg-chelatase subunit ChlD
LRAYVEGLLSSDSNSRVGVILFSSSARVEIPLGSTRTPQQLLQQVSTLTYLGGGTNTAQGLCLLKTMPWRRSTSVLRIAVVLTDGQSSGITLNCPQSGGLGGTLSSTAAEVHS